jgi:hypothetical protein
MALGNRIQTVDELMGILLAVKNKTGGNTKIKFYNTDDHCEIPEDNDYLQEYIEHAHLRGQVDLLDNNKSSGEDTCLYLGVGG